MIYCFSWPRIKTRLSWTVLLPKWCHLGHTLGCIQLDVDWDGRSKINSYTYPAPPRGLTLSPCLFSSPALHIMFHYLIV